MICPNGRASEMSTDGQAECGQLAGGLRGAAPCALPDSRSLLPVTAPCLRTPLPLLPSFFLPPPPPPPRLLPTRRCPAICLVLSGFLHCLPCLLRVSSLVCLVLSDCLQCLSCLEACVFTRLSGLEGLSLMSAVS